MSFVESCDMFSLRQQKVFFDVKVISPKLVNLDEYKWGK